MLKHTVCTSSLLFLFAASYVQGRLVIRAAENANTSGCYIVKLHNSTSHAVFEGTRQNAMKLSDDSKVHAAHEGVFKFFTVCRLSQKALDLVKDLENVEYVEEETMVSGTASTSSWALDRIDQTSSTLDGMYNPGSNRDGQGVDIYIFDTGIRYDHSEFGGRAKYPGFDPIDDYDDTNRQGEDCHGHGTHVASLAAGNLYGVAKKATVYSVRVLRCNNGAPWSTVLNGLDSVVDKVKMDGRPAVISMSLGGSFTRSVNDAVREVTDAGIPVVVAAGNDNANACHDSPGSAASAVTVGGTADGDGLYYYTNGGSCVDIFSPGESIRGADYGSRTGSRYLSGTSMATPIVSGVLAIYLQEQPSLSVQELTQLLIDNSIKGALDLSRLSSFELDGTSPNRLVQIKNAPQTSNTHTVTNTVTSTSTVISTSTMSVTMTLPVTTVYYSTTKLVPTTIVSTSTVTTTSTRNVPTTTTVTTTTTPVVVGLDECDVSASIDTLKSNLVTTVEEIMEAGFYIIADIIGGNRTINIRLGDDESEPAQSCQEILRLKPYAESGDYWLKHSNGSAISVHCKMEEINGRKGMMRVAEIDMNQPDSKCPGELHLRTDPKRMCERGTNLEGCSTAMFSTQGIPYKTVCGRVNAVQYGSPNAFFWFVKNQHLTVNDLYVDGAILSRMSTKGNRSHVWTFSAALDELDRPDFAFACPCTNNNVTTQFAIPEFVGEDYFCETGSVDGFEYGRYYVEDPLWDGNGCGLKSTCCSRGNYFCKTFDTATTDDIELRLCGNEVRTNEDTPITLLDLYIQ